MATEPSKAPPSQGVHTIARRIGELTRHRGDLVRLQEKAEKKMAAVTKEIRKIRERGVQAAEGGDAVDERDAETEELRKTAALRRQVRAAVEGK